jgi:hypothetical protein
MYWEYMVNIIQEQLPRMVYDPSIIYEPLSNMTFYGDFQDFFDSFQKNIISQLSNLDLVHFAEANIKQMLLTILFQSNFYLPHSETENSKGYTDIYLERRDYLYPKITTNWVWELKYIKQKDAENQEVIAEKKAKALEQIQRNKSSTRFKDRKDVRYLTVQKKKKKDYLAEEVIFQR